MLCPRVLTQAAGLGDWCAGEGLQALVAGVLNKGFVPLQLTPLSHSCSTQWDSASLSSSHRITSALTLVLGSGMELRENLEEDQEVG